MRCEDFTDWLQETLDQRDGLELSRDLQQHVRECDCCRGQLDAWHKIASIMPNANAAIDQQAISVKRRLKWHRVERVAGIVAAAAAVVLLVFVIANSKSDSTPHAKVETTESTAEETIDLEPAIAIVDPAIWWQQFQNRDWIGQTMPTVQSVRDGVAPFGKPFMQAVSILTMGGRDQPS